MANMSYCRFENTTRDLADCFEALEEKGIEGIRSDIERGEARELFVLCQRYVELYRELTDESK